MRCNYCEWRCELGPQQYGVCQMYYVDQGEIRERFPHRWSSYSVSRMESLPLYHAYPGARCMTIGTTSCNFMCRYCSNGFVARRDPAEQIARMYVLSPEEMVRMARKLGCHNIVFNVNEPTVSLQTLAELKVHADEAGLPMGCLTNGYTTEESTELLCSIFSFMNISLKGFTPEFYQEYLGARDLEPVLRNIRRIAQTCHVEVTTPVIQGVNDGELMEMADFVADIDPQIPWHVFRLLPEHEMTEARYPSIDAINEALHDVRKKLDYVYFHNFVGSDWVNTICPGCGHEVIERFSLGCGGDRLCAFDCQDNRCPVCGQEIKIHGTRVLWNAMEVAR